MPNPHFVKKTFGVRNRIMRFTMQRKARFIWEKIKPHLLQGSTLDIGMGAGSISHMLAAKGFSVKGVDVHNFSLYQDLQPILYNGEKLPFKDKQFTNAVIIHVLHHCNDGVAVLKEAKRVAKRVIVIEDTYQSWFEWLFTSVSDALNNGELWFHTYRTESEWKKIIKQHNWKLLHFSLWKEWFVAAIYGKYCMFVIE
ncbi:MAG: bifunctional 3-demethylubiquinone-9 3-methyltransferase/ 2-octaprenyl-6-hydroxy phenol methylase [Microgenomates bacterium OLB23]|nr:MAG: bifunctional 3-demethylubiquinone-9 3-methyltransferase/ 2-octaprenyl-6-hydroxy phenol methylase [Microgenomates bacterium OLB23]